MRKSILSSITFLPILILFLSCADNSETECETGDEQICYCDSLYAGVQTCEDGVWGECWCEGANDTDTDTGTDVLDQTPEVDVTANPSSGTAPLEVSFVATVVGGNEPMAYSWDFGDDGAPSSEPNPTHTYNAGGTYTAVVTVTDDDGDQAIGGTTVNVADDTEPTVEISAGPTIGLAPLSVTFEAIAMGGNPPYTYEWDFNGDDAVDATIQNPVKVFTPGAYEAKVTVTDADGDQAEDTVDIYAALPDQVPDVIAEIVEGDCISVPGEQVVQLSGVASSDLEGAITYEWVFVTVPFEEEDNRQGIEDLEFEPSAFIANPRFTPPINGLYQVQLFVSDGVHTVGSEILDIEVSDEPAAVIPVAGDGQSGQVDAEFDELFVGQVVNSCGAPIPNVQVWANGFNAGPYGEGRNAEFWTDENGEFDFWGWAGIRAGQAGIRARAGCIAGTWNLTVLAGDAEYLVMNRFAGTPVVSDETGADLSFEVTDGYLNPVAEKVQFGLMMEVYGVSPERSDYEYYYYCTGDDDDDSEDGGACFEESMKDEDVDDPFDLEECRNLSNILTDENGKRTVKVISRTDQPIRVWFHQAAKIISGPNIGKELMTFGREVYRDSFESLANWANWIKGKEDDSQWDRGAPAAGVGPASAHTGGNLIGTNLSGDYTTPPGEMPIKRQAYPIYQDDLYRPIPSTTFESSYNWPNMTFIEFWHWYDMIGDTCPDCAAATGFVSGRGMSVVEPPGLDLDADIDGDVDIDMPYLSSYNPVGDYPGPDLCYDETPGPLRPTMPMMPLLGFSGKSDGWEPTYFYYENILRKDLGPMSVMDLAFVFSTSTLGEADGAGWYIDDLVVSNLFGGETGYLYIQFNHDVPNNTRICLVQDGYVNNDQEAPMCEESADAAVLATVYDQFNNRIAEPDIELLFGANDGEGSLASAVFDEVLKGALVAGAGSTVARATTSDDGDIVLTISNDESEEVEVSSDLEGVLFADDETWVYFHDTEFLPGDCCDNPYDLGVSDYFYNSLAMCNYHALDQLPECGDPTRTDIVFKFRPSQDDLYVISHWSSSPYYYDTIAELRVLDEDGNCPGTPVQNEGNPEQGSCIEDSMYAYLYKDKTYILSVQYRDQNDYINCSGSTYDIVYINVSSAS
jgi:PKD repeat protein